ncbi:MAG: hypothetical protein KGH55_02220 [Nanoarchaeota archaeon]|nr:hypothetical protein [Nanoarchaeota archaeon]
MENIGTNLEKVKFYNEKNISYILNFPSQTIIGRHDGRIILTVSRGKLYCISFGQDEKQANYGVAIDINSEYEPARILKNAERSIVNRIHRLEEIAEERGTGSYIKEHLIDNYNQKSKDQKRTLPHKKSENKSEVDAFLDEVLSGEVVGIKS